MMVKAVTTPVTQQPGQPIDAEAILAQLQTQGLDKLDTEGEEAPEENKASATELTAAADEAPIVRLANAILALSDQPDGEAPLLALLEIRRVIAGVVGETSARHLGDPLHAHVEKVAIVRHRDHRPGVLGEEALEPRDRLGVEVVGRLVEQQQVGTLEEQPAERHAAALAPRERLDRGLGRRASERVHRDLERAVQLPQVPGIDRILEFRLLVEELLHGVIVHRLGELPAHLVEAVEQRLLLRHPLLDHLDHGLGRVERLPRLVDVAQLHRVPQAQPAGVTPPQ